MKKISIIVLLFFYLCGTTHLHEIFKLPLLIDHFVEHSQSNKNLTFWEFLDDHYAKQNDGISSDDDKDMKLPFKSHQDCVNYIVAFSMVPNTPNFFEPIYTNPVNFLDYNSAILSSSFLDNIWQPPKFS